MSKPFQFREFKVYHDQCGHKIGTDSLILGSWLGQVLKMSPRSILDIGTGSGVLALMMAQHFPNARIDAVEIESGASRQAQENFTLNPIGKNCKAHHSSLQDYKHSENYDLLISNPPFFKSTSKAPEQKRQTARSQDQMTVEDLFVHSSRLSHSGSYLATVFPMDLEEVVNKVALQKSWFPHQILYTFSDQKPPNRFFVIWSREKAMTQKSTMQIRSQGKYSDAYKELTWAFHDRKL